MTTAPPSGPALPPLRNPRIVIEKSKGRLTVFDGATIRKQYAVIVGARTGDKRIEGDYRTPEGEFFVCVKNPRSKFTLSLGLNYPRASDARRGLSAGLISARQCQQIVEAHGGYLSIENCCAEGIPLDVAKTGIKTIRDLTTK